MIPAADIEKKRGIKKRITRSEIRFFGVLASYSAVFLLHGADIVLALKGMPKRMQNETPATVAVAVGERWPISS